MVLQRVENSGMFSGLDLAFLTPTFSAAVSSSALSGPSIVDVCARLSVCALGVSQDSLSDIFSHITLFLKKKKKEKLRHSFLQRGGRAGGIKELFQDCVF